MTLWVKREKFARIMSELKSKDFSASEHCVDFVSWVQSVAQQPSEEAARLHKGYLKGNVKLSR